MEIVYIMIAFVLAVTGILGAIYPIIPAAVVSYGSLVVFYFATNDKLSLTALIVWGIVVAVVSVIDMVLPPLITKKAGGSKCSAKGSFIGILVGSLFLPPFGMLLGAFFGALIGEWSVNRRLDSKSFGIAMASFLAFIFGTGLKLIVSIMILITLILKLV